MHNQKFYDDLEALLRKHNMVSLDGLWYNNPENVAAFKEAAKDYGDLYSLVDNMNIAFDYDIYDMDVEYVPSGFWYSSRCY